MAIKKQEFYEGAALHQLARNGGISAIRFDPPFVVLNNRVVVNLKYSTKGRSPWGFTFMPDEQALLHARASRASVVIALICGADGVAAISYDSYRTIATPRKSSIHIACYRQHGKHYTLKGPDGVLDEKSHRPIGDIFFTGEAVGMRHCDQVLGLLQKQIGNQDEVRDIRETAQEVAAMGASANRRQGRDQRPDLWARPERQDGCLDRHRRNWCG